MSILKLPRNRFVESNKLSNEIYRVALTIGVAHLLDAGTTKPEVKEHIKAALIDPKAVPKIQRKA